MKAWDVATATTVGESHVIRGRGSDDAVATARYGKWIALVACDGAGSAPRSREGAESVSSAFAEQLLEIASEIDFSDPGPWINDALISAILKIRKELAGVAGSYELREFHCTLVAVLVSDSGGFSVQIGDGAVFLGRRLTNGGSQIAVHSEPENGEYANETFFVTETTWLKNLRIKPLGPCDWVVVTTDGAACLLLANSIKYDVFSELFDELSAEVSLDGVNAVLTDLIRGDYARAVSNDDKSIGLAFQNYNVFSEYKKGCTDYSGLAEQTISAAKPFHELPETASAQPNSKISLTIQSIQRLILMQPRRPIVIAIAALVTTAAVIIASHYSTIEPKAPRFAPAAQCTQPMSNKPYPCGL